jgi:RNA polymerase sigma factor (sigma-70 family)
MTPRSAVSGPVVLGPLPSSERPAAPNPARPPDLLGEAFGPTLAGARAGDGTAFARLYDNVAPLVLGYLRGLRAVDPADLAGDVFVDLVHGLDTFTGDERQFRSWLLAIAHRRATDDRRRRQEQPIPADVAEPTGPAGPGDAAESSGSVLLDTSRRPDGPSAVAEDRAVDDLSVLRILDAIDGLTPDQCAAVMLRVVADLTVPEMAVALGKPPTAVNALLRRATARLSRSSD